MKSLLINQLESIAKEKLKIDCELAPYTSFKTGGRARALIEVESTEILIKCLKVIKEFNEKYYVFGNCSNVLISDKPLDAVVLILSKSFSDVTINGCEITAKSGIRLSNLSKIAYSNALGGLEFASGIPGTLGAGVAINAGAYDGEMSKIVKTVTYIDENLNLVTVDNSEIDFGYRHSRFLDKCDVIVETTLTLYKEDKEVIKAKMDEFKKKRKEKQPLELPSAGSVFKRPEGYYAGKLIEDSGLKGYRINDAMVSDKHCGFIVNMGKATSKDVYDLIQYIKKEVFEKYGVILETEVRLIGNF